MVNNPEVIDRLTVILRMLSLLVCLCWFGNNLVWAGQEEVVFEVTTRDSITLKIWLRSDQDLPDHYQCLVATPVCDDGLCRMMKLRVYWDLLGNFEAFDTLPGQPLTKWDHLEFTNEDYRKLEEILADQRSLLGRVQNVDDLFDKSTKKVSEKVDAVTGATRETVKNAVVPGAVYSTYTMWHIVNGPIADSMRMRIGQMSTDELFRKFLLSGNHQYHYYALDHMTEFQYQRLREEILVMLKDCSPFVRKQAISDLPSSLLSTCDFQSAVIGLWSAFDYFSQEALMDRLQTTAICQATVNALIGVIDTMNDFQMGRALRLITNSKRRPDQKAVQKLGQLMVESDLPTSELLYSFLHELSEQDRTAKKILKRYEKTKM
jgi:hypothetical protein